MSSPLLDQVDHALRAGKPEVAIQAARQYAESATDAREAGIAIAKSAAAVYRDLIAPPVEAFMQMAPEYLPGEVGTLVQKALQRLVRISEEWEAKLWDIHTERLTRELRDWVRTKHLKPAAANLARLMALAPEEQRSKRAAYIGTVLGTIINNQKEAAQLVQMVSKDPAAHFMTAEQAKAMDASRQKRHQELGSADLETIERQWTEILTQIVVDIKGKLPDEMKMDEPDETALRDFGDVVRSLLRAPILREEPDLFLDATNILIEFIAKEQSATSKMARQEGRVYNTLGVTAKKTVMMTFLEIGKNTFFTQVYKNWARGYLQTADIKQIVELMGAFRSTDFNEFFKLVQSDKQASQTVEQVISSAYGAVAGEEAADELMSQLRGILSHKRLDSSDLKNAEQIIASLCAIIRSPRTEQNDRRKIREFLRTHVPEDITALANYTALKGFTFKVDETTPDQRQWAVRVLVRGMWMPDDTTVHHKGDEKTSELGFRADIVNALVKLAPDEIDALTRAMEPLTGRYGTAFLAAAELLGQLKRQETLNLLERILNNTLMHDDTRSNIYQQEYIWDPVTGQRKPLTKDKVIEPIIHAVGSIGGPEAQAILHRYRDQIATGKVAQPSDNTANFLEKFLGDQAYQAPEGAEEAAPEVANVDELIKQISKRYLLSGKDTRRMKKVEALTKLARLQSIDALDAVFDQLTDKDIMIVSAAITCLAEYAAPNKPKALRDLTINTCLERFESKDPAMRQAAVKLLRQIGPNRKDVKDKVLAFAKMTERREAREALADAIRTGTGAPPPTEALEALGHKKQTEGMEALEAKRQYLAARQDWIKGGKKGDPPAKPPGVDI